MRTLRPFPVLGGLAVPAALALFGADPALAQDPPSAPAGCGTSGLTTQAIVSVSSTETSIMVTYSNNGSDFHALVGALQICNADGETAVYGDKNGSSRPVGETLTYTTFGAGDEAPALTAGTDYWIRWQSYSSSQAWVYARTAGSSASVSLALNSAGTDSTYHNGDAIEVTATFGENVTVTGTPQIPMTIGSNTRNATYESGSGGTELVFSYTVVTADVDNDGIEIAENALTLNGGTINVGSDAAALDHAAVAASTDHKVDGAATGVTSVAMTSNAGTDQTYALGDVISVGVTFGGTVTVSGTPRVQLSPAFGPRIGGTGPHGTNYANYHSGSGTTTLTFRYVVAAGDEQADGIGVAANGLELNGGTIEYAAGKPAALGHAAVAASASHKVDGVRPALTNQRFTNVPGTGYRTIGSDIEFTFSYGGESMRVTTGGGTPRIPLTPDFGPGDPPVTRYAEYDSGSGTGDLVFKYTLQEGDDSGTDNVGVARNSLDLNGGTITDGAGNTIASTHVSASSGKTVKAVRPTISHVQVATGPGIDADLDGHNETFLKDEVVTVRVVFDQPLQIDRMGSFANIQTVLTIGTTDYPLSHSGLIASNTALAFESQRVKATDRDDDGITLERQSATNHVIRLSGGATIKGTAANGANAANLVLAADPNVVWISGTDTVTSLNVRGTNAAPVSTDFTVTTAVDTDYTFSATDFTFTDPESDPLKEIQIVRLPTNASGTLKLSGTAIPDGDLPKTVSRSDIANLVFDPASGYNGNATFTFKVVDPFGAVSMDAATARVTVGTPLPTITIAAGTSPVTEATAAQFTVTADVAPAANLTVNLTVSESDDGDYVAPADEGGKTVVINAGSTSANYSVTTQDDSNDEADGSVTVTVAPGTGYHVGAASSDTVAVNDDDDPPMVPAGCATGVQSVIRDPFTSLSSTPGSITVTYGRNASRVYHPGSDLRFRWDDRRPSPFGSKRPPNTTETFTTFGHGDSAPALTADTDYWLRVLGYGAGTAWHYIRTKSEPVGPAVTIAAGSAVTEGTAATFTLTIAEAPTADVTVNLTVSEKSGSDFVASANEGAKTATISHGQHTGQLLRRDGGRQQGRAQRLREGDGGVGQPATAWARPPRTA